MSKHLKLFSALLVLMVLAPISVFVFPSNAEAARSLVENSWRYEDGQLVAEDVSSEEDGIALLSMDILPDGATAQGIDVSEHQGRIDWNAVKASGIDFAILRVGFGAPSWGGRVDYQFNRNISECERLGIPYGVYIYSYAFDNQQAADEASMVIDCLSGHNPRLPVYYDLEDKTIIADGRQSGIASRAQTFCNKISSAGYKPGIYANLNWFNNILTDPVFKSGSWDHWIAQYNSQCHYTASYSFWQYTSRGKVSGISGNVDMNYAYVDVSLYYWQLKEGTWYYATSDGKAYTGWLRQGGAWYWLDPDAGGVMATGLYECNGSMYWFNASGAMATGWVLDGGTWYYATGSGALARGPVSVGGVPYCFDARTGAMLTGYQTDAQGVRRYFGSCGPLNGWGLVDGSWYWFADGIASTGWLYTGGSWYWLEPDAGGAMATGLHSCHGSAYWFNDSGAMATGWVLDGGTWYYATGSGALASGWLNLNGAWYWLDPSTHAMATGVQTIGSCEYIFNSTGKMMANCWSNGDGSWMYHSSSSGAIDLKGIMTDSGIQLIDDDGNARTGWIESQGARYYCSASGVILTGWQQIAGSWYYFNPDGRMATGWLNDGSNWYLLDSASGAMKTGWLSLGGTWYYLDVARGGVMLSNGWYWIGSTDYKFSSSGAMVGAWVDVPCYSQYPELPTGCESVALTNLLNYYGFGLGKTIIADYYLPKGSNGNFVTAFDGNPRRSSGGLMGCVAPAITIAGNNFLRAAGSGKQAKDVSFSSISSIKNRLTCGQPVEMWNTEWGSWPGGRYAARWYNGHSYGLWGGNHAVVLKGYDDEQGIVYLSDSINGNVTRNAQVFFGTWQQMDSQAVVIE
ncbi:GH25 family lysozyme [Collinsella aerofaciens]|uniref:Toxin A n=1 Tax=Collinsella aerofaciens TaxID=74426 RepID=A0A174D2Y3_9ACTN|nr:GH25 family lysozyme [Collinsella aerofaciens]CUO19607.1 Toxin A [Collinsella aerofaciens]